VKFAGAGNGATALAAELLVARLAVRWQLPVPAARPIWLGADVARAGTDEFWDVMDASAGWNLAIDLVEGARDVEVVAGQRLDPATERALLWIDVLFANLDRTRLSANILEDADGRVWLIDHGSCRFLQRMAAGDARFELAPNHFLRGMDVRAALAGVREDCEDYDDTTLAALTSDLPAAWLAGTGVTDEDLVPLLARRLRAFARWISEPAAGR
jgi:hypothetical protein